MNFVEALSKTKQDTDTAAALPAWPKGDCVWYEKGSLYPDVMVRRRGSVAAMELGTGLDADDLLREDWQVVVRW